MMKETVNKSFKCANCGTEHEFPAYVYAHWDMMLTHTCTCGAQHHIRQGIATRAYGVPAQCDVGVRP